MSPVSFIGRTLDTLTGGIGDDITLLIQDASPRVGLPSSYSGEADLDGRWAIVAICTSARDVAAADSIEVAVVPEASMSRQVRDDVAAGDYRDAVHCDGRPFHG